MNPLKIVTLTLAILSSLSSFAEVRPEEGNERGNGGDEYAKEFVRVGYDVLESLMNDPLPGVDNNALLAAIRHAKVNSRPRLTLRGNDVDAINFPDANGPRILVSRAGWDRMKSARHRRSFLVLHEYLSIMGVDDSSYQVSLQLDRAGICERNSWVRKGIEDSIRKFCYRITAEDVHFIDPILTIGNWQENGDGEELRERDLAGLTRLTTLTYYSPLSRVRADAFDSTPNLHYISIRAPRRIDRLNDNSVVRSLLLNDDFSRTCRLAQISDGAFSGLTNLRFLSACLSLKHVRLERALSGIRGLSQLDLFLQDATEVPASYIEVVKRNPDLQRLVLSLLNGKIGNAIRSQLTALGFFCKDESGILPGERISCEQVNR